MNASFHQMPSTANLHLLYDVNSSSYCVSGGCAQDRGKNCRNKTQQSFELGSESPSILSSISDAGATSSFGAYAYNGCWYPYASTIVPCQSPSSWTWNVQSGGITPVLYPAMQTSFVFNPEHQMIASPQNTCEVLQSTGRNHVQMPPALATGIHNSVDYIWLPAKCDEGPDGRYSYDTAFARPNSSENSLVKARAQYHGSKNVVMLQTEQATKPSASTNAVMLGPALMQYCASEKLIGRPSLYLQNLLNITSDIEMMYSHLRGSNVPNGHGRPTLLTPYASFRSPGLEFVWRKHFALLFGLLEGQWHLVPTNSAPTDGYALFRDMAKVRFSCQFCLRGWTSMFGVVLFFYQWDPAMKLGQVRFILMGQSCNQCVKKEVFETPMWYPEEAQKVMTNLFYEISSRVYGQEVPPFNRDRRHGRPRHQHNAQQCQGCVLKLCKPKREISSSENRVLEDIGSRSTTTPALNNAEDLDDGVERSRNLDTVCKAVKALTVRRENDGPQSACETDEERKRELQTKSNEVRWENVENFTERENIGKINGQVKSSVPVSNGDDGFQRDPRVVAAIENVRKALAKKSN